MGQQGQGRTQKNIMIAGVSASLISTIVTNPIQVAKLKLQYAPMNCPRYPHLGLRDLYKCGCASFQPADAFKGLSVMLPQVILNNFLFMQLYEYQRQLYIQYLPSTQSTLLSSMIARIIVTIALIPAEALRVRISNSTPDKKIQTAQKGLLPTLIRDTSFSVLYWITAEQIRNYWVGTEYRQASKQLTIQANLLAGGLGGAFISLITTPFDTIKTRIQSGINLEGSLPQQLKAIYHKQGLNGLFSGFQYRMAKSSTHSALYLMLYETFLNRLGSANKNQ